jgi:hypothetical protein
MERQSVTGPGQLMVYVHNRGFTPHSRKEISGSIAWKKVSSGIFVTVNLHLYTTGQEQYEGVRLKKYEIKAGEVSERDHDLVLMRWAEILMMKAECYVRLGNPGDAYPLVEQIRIRSGLTTTPNPITLEVLDTEWLHEFLFEGLRRTVNIRFGTYFEPWWSKPNPTPVEKAIFPIPETELEINNKLVQNPGY